MNRRSFLKTVPLLCSATKLCTILAFGAKKEAARGKDPQVFRWVSYQGGNRQLAYEDLWDPHFQSRCQEAIKQYQPASSQRRKPSLASLGPVPSWNLTQSRQEREMDWVSFTRQLPATSPGKKQYVRFLLNRYHHRIDRINHRYGSQANGWSDLMAHPFVKVNLQNIEIFKDDQAFLRILQQKWANDVRRLLRPVSPSHMTQMTCMDVPERSQSRFAIL